MPVELRKRKAPETAPAPIASKKKTKANTTISQTTDKVKEVITPKEKALTKTNGSATASSSKTGAKSGSIEVGSMINIETFGGEVLTNNGEITSLKMLLDESKNGVVLFTYPKASTGGCTNQVCLFRDSYTPLTATGLSIYGLSRDSTTANTNFKTKQKLPYPLLCDKPGTLIDAIGFKKGTSATRGVIVISKEGKVLAREAAGPAATVEVVRKLVGEGGDVEMGDEKEVNGEKKGDEGEAEVAAEVADTAETLGDK